MSLQRNLCLVTNLGQGRGYTSEYRTVLASECLVSLAQVGSSLYFPSAQSYFLLLLFSSVDCKQTRCTPSPVPHLFRENLACNRWLTGVCKIQNSFTSFFPVGVPFISFSCLISLARTPSIMLNESSESGHLCVFLLLEETLCFSLLAMMLAEGLSHVVFVMLRYFPSVPILLRIFIIN